MSVAANTTPQVSAASRANVWNSLGIALTGIGMVVTIVITLYSLILALTWYSRPFLGVFLYQNGVVIGTRPLAGSQWTGLDAGLQGNDQIVRVDSEVFTVSKSAGLEISNYLATKRVGQVVDVQIFRPDSPFNTAAPSGCTTGNGVETCTFRIKLMQLPFLDFAGFFGLGFIMALAAISLSIWMWSIRRDNVAARHMIWVCLAGAVTFLGRFETTATYQFGPVLIVSISLLAVFILQTGLHFPYTFALLRRQPLLNVTLSVGPAILILGYAGFTILQPEQVASNWPATILLACLVIISVLSILSMYIRRRSAIATLTREQSTVVLVAAIVPIVPSILWLVTNWVEQRTGITAFSFSTIYLQPLTVVFPLGFAYAILQRRAMDSDRIISEGMVLTALGMLLIIGYILLTGAAFALTQGVLQPNNPLLIASTLFVIAVLFTPARSRLERYVDEAFFRQRREYDRRLEQFARNLTATLQMPDITDLLSNELRETLSPQYMFVFLHNATADDYSAAPNRATGRTETNLRFKSDGGLIRTITNGPTVLHMGREGYMPSELQADRSRLAVLNTPVLAKMYGGQRLNGFIALGPRGERGDYTHEDLRYLESIATQAAAAYERAQIVIESQRNERELTVLFQVSAALNIPMDFDTLLEFVFAQVDKVIPSPNFYIVLRDPRTDELFYAFYQEGGERISEKEGQRWPMGRDLLSEVIRSQQPFRTDNYPREMQRRDSSNRVDNQNLRAWLGVPLNAGETSTLGCLAMASTDANQTYSEDQTRIFWSIADLAATAIYKTRLFSETSELARQMQILNDTSARLATLYEDVDALLQSITEAAVDILTCEAGSLLLVDEDTGELVFRCAVGGPGQDLIGERIPSNTGIAGTVVMTGRHLIVNEANRDPRWFGEVGVNNDSPKAFATNSILAVPLNARGKVIGVLEVINKKDMTSFDDDSVNLMTTFAGQAAIAIENANLFRLTDEALAERVKQLFNMQRIDQELNRTLDLQRVVDLTVDNALRESNADAGALALVSMEPPGLRVVGCAGYPEKILVPGTMFAMEEGPLSQTYETAQSILRSVLPGTSSTLMVLPGAINQLCVPLITGETVTGVLLLESTLQSTFTPMTAEHIQGLAEHANTAITNARLFAQLGEANQGRTKIMRTVAHELNNPMTSIKGYADFMITGVFGQLNERQRDMMLTIQRNVVRMQQIVEDLRDMTAQETGTLQLKFGVVNFYNVVLDAVRPQQRSLDEKHQTLVLNVSEKLPRVWGDEIRLIQVLVNFVSNANKYTPEGGTITITAEESPNMWDPEGAKQVIHCQVTDTGIGMSKGDLNSLFKPYWRSENPLAQEQKGTGLGMSLTKGLIESHGGRVWVESTINVGTTFHFTVPLTDEREAVR